MRFVVPMSVNAANLTTNVTNDDADWAAGTYTLGQRATEGESVYEVVVASTTDQPSVGAALATPSWILLGYSNVWRMWRDGVDSSSEAVGDLEVSVPVPTVISTVGVLNAFGVDANVRLLDSLIVPIEPPNVEEIAGTKDGVNTAFTITEAGAAVLLVFLNGVYLYPTVGYVRVGTDITALAGYIPHEGDSYVVEIYTSDVPTREDVAGTKDGVNTAFTITEAGGVAHIFLDGVKQIEGVDYERNGTDITATGSIPYAGSLYEAIIFASPVPQVENVSGTKNGFNTSFLISMAGGGSSLFLNGIRQVEDVDYERDGIHITATGSIPGVGDTYQAVVYPNGVIYDSTKLITDISVGDWWEFFFSEYNRDASLIFDDIPAYFGAGVTLEVTIHSTGPGDPSSVGRVVIGSSIDAGQSLQGVSSRNMGFTQKTRDEFGGLTLVPRRTIRVVEFPVMILKGNTYYVQQKAASIEGVPTLFIADPNLPETVVFGVIESFDIIVNGLSRVECSIGVEEF